MIAGGALDRMTRRRRCLRQAGNDCYADSEEMCWSDGQAGNDDRLDLVGLQVLRELLWLAAPRASSSSHYLGCHGVTAHVREVLRATVAGRSFLVQFKEGVATGVLRRCKKILSFLAWGFKELRWCLELSGTLGKLGYFDQSIHAAISLKRY